MHLLNTIQLHLFHQQQKRSFFQGDDHSVRIQEVDTPREILREIFSYLFQENNSHRTFHAVCLTSKSFLGGIQDTLRRRIAYPFYLSPEILFPGLREKKINPSIIQYFKETDKINISPNSCSLMDNNELINALLSYNKKIVQLQIFDSQNISIAAFKNLKNLELTNLYFYNCKKINDFTFKIF